MRSQDEDSMELEGRLPSHAGAAGARSRFCCAARRLRAGEGRIARALLQSGRPVTVGGLLRGTPPQRSAQSGAPFRPGEHITSHRCAPCALEGQAGRDGLPAR